MELSVHSCGDAAAPPVAILHGLLGSSRNWQAAARELAAAYRVHCLDLPGHGGSPASGRLDYPGLAAAAAGWLEGRGIEAGRLIGHSIGGKAAMRLACRRPELVARLLVVDIVPKTYPKSHDETVGAMRELDLARLESRREADARLAERIGDWGLRQFLLTNLERSPEGGFRWIPDLAAIGGSLRELERSPLEADDRYEGPTLFVMGERSDYYRAAEDRERIERHFPRARVEVLPGCGHNPHFERREAFCALAMAFFGERE